MVDLSSTATLVLLFCASLVLLSAILSPKPLLRWLQRKRYQYEVTFSLYMLTPTEKFIFNSFLFLFLSMIIIAASLYLPEHITTIAHRVFYYLAGDEHSSLKTVAAVQPVKQVMEHTVATSAGEIAGGLMGNGRAVMEA
ncbi:hypothetical protein EJ05DRAFT_478971 [Pseudovirgaria hyperparasitica]|uniref:Uncharacterized protein n=1 Tax=Pseudovirgaria hyperparasitica TaxID=470096 RepID=A0A6A6VZ65_9PEZI|nr:uncharacterized protein EJ05DRAFT_478971 [Pseudovirgaria hyperparasitica]KAF2755169.1 hypothetical protein EJ05DRAFT_478971 [Pseudovirgaria hyperparasitica]